MSDEWPIISEYSWKQGVADGFLVELLKHRWSVLTSGKPLLATSHLHAEVSMAGLMEIWNEYVVWSYNVAPTLPEAERMFSTTMNGETVWVIDDGIVFTMMFPSDY